MSNTDKCFCHLNGYAVKDATARQQIDTINYQLDVLAEYIGETLEDITNRLAALETTVTALAEKYEVVENSAIIVDEIEIETGLD